MELWKVELVYGFDRISRVSQTYYFKTQKEAKEFTEKGNEILHRNEAYYSYGLRMKEYPVDFELNEVDKELDKLAKEFKNYVY